MSKKKKNDDFIDDIADKLSQHYRWEYNDVQNSLLRLKRKLEKKRILSEQNFLGGVFDEQIKKDDD